MKRFAFIIFMVSVAASGAESFLSDRDREHIDKALSALAMTPADAGFEKDVGKPVWTLGWVTNTLADPFSLPVTGKRILDAAASGDRARIWVLAAELMEVPVEFNAAAVTENIKGDALAQFTAEALHVARMVSNAFAAVSIEERVYLAASVMASVFEAEIDVSSRDVLARAGIPREAQERIEREGEKLDGTEDALAWLKLAESIDRGTLAAAGRRFQEAVRVLKNFYRQQDAWPDEMARIDSEAGLIIIGTRGNDVYDEPALLIIDPGGDDVYAGSAGAANGLLNQPLAAVIDLGGADLYKSSELLGAGSAIWGIAVLLDDAGDDIYEAGFCGSGGALFGVAWVEDAGGHDRYAARSFGQGAAVAGFGVHIDHAGDDQYDIGFQGQGFAGVMGWGLLLDRDGHDRYFAGNVRRDHERNDERFLSLAQGFSIGMRPHAGGGVGALVDLRGNDHYAADVYGQGVSYYYAAGFLIDVEGHDRYSLYQYGQGCGIHLSHGLLADLAGNDYYQGHILSQGSAHDYAVGFLIEHGGDDTYTGDHHTQGRALNNSFAVLLDRAGQDGYFARQRDGGQGIGNNGGFRDYGSLALLMDLGDKDIYSGGFSNGTVTLRPLYGVVYDYEEAQND